MGESRLGASLWNLRLHGQPLLRMPGNLLLTRGNDGVVANPQESHKYSSAVHMHQTPSGVWRGLRD